MLLVRTPLRASAAKRPRRLAEALANLESCWTAGDVERALVGVSGGGDARAYAGTVGGGNHFAELLRVDRTERTERSSSSSSSSSSSPSSSSSSEEIDDDALYLLVHSGSRGYGAAVLREYLDAVEHDDASAVDAAAEAAYLRAHDDAVEFGRRNRLLLAARFLRCLLDFERVRLRDDLEPLAMPAERRLRRTAERRERERAREAGRRAKARGRVAGEQHDAEHEQGGWERATATMAHGDGAGDDGDGGDGYGDDDDGDDEEEFKQRVVRIGAEDLVEDGYENDGDVNDEDDYDDDEHDDDGDDDDERASAHSLVESEDGVFDLASAVVFDVVHNFVERTAEGEYLHRKGAAPSDRHALLAVPGSRGARTHLVRPLANAHTRALALSSIAHGAGRRLPRSVAGAAWKRATRSDIEALRSTAFGSVVVCEDRALLFEEAPGAYKDVEAVVDDLVGASLVERVVALTPVLTFKTRRSS